MLDWLPHFLFHPTTLAFVGFAVLCGVVLLTLDQLSTRPKRAPSEPPEDLPLIQEDAHIERINELTRTARTSWFGLLSYLAFVGVTLVGVQDADFFIIERETQLPLVGVSIPTLTFFWVAPALGAALYTYFRLHLVKLWEAISVPPAAAGDERLSERLAPWLVVDFALMFRKDALPPERPMVWLTWGVSLLLSYIAGPLVLGFFWIKSMPAHEWELTILGCGLPFAASLYSGTSSLSYLWFRIHGGTVRSARTLWAGRATWLLIFAAVSAIGSFRTYQPIGHYYLDERVRQALMAEGMSDRAIEQRLQLKFWNRWWLTSLSRAELAKVDFVATPTEWRDFETARKDYRIDWCGANGVPKIVCGPASPFAEADGVLWFRRLEWCRDTMEDWNEAKLAEQCETEFLALDNTFAVSWDNERDAQFRELKARGLSGRDLRNANLSETRLAGANLNGARLEGAILISARLEGAILRGAGLEGANLRMAQLEEANLDGARLAGANLSRARLEGAFLNSEARLEGANLIEARLEGASLIRARFDEETNFDAATFHGAALKSVECTKCRLNRDQLSSVFADGSVQLPQAILDQDPGFWPAHWPREALDWSEFEERWRAWQREIGYAGP